MKVIFNRNEISAAVAPLMSAVSGKSSLTATEGILIEAKMPDTCIMTTYDLQKGVRITVEAKVIEEGSFIINAQKFVQTLRVMDGEEITLTVDSKLSASFVSGRSSHKMIALKGEDFPSIPELSSDRSFIMSQAILKNMISKVDFAMGVNDQRAVLNGTFFKITDDSIMLVSCDSFKLAKCRQKADLVNKNTNGNAHLEYSFIVPVKTVNELSRLLDDDDEALTQIFVTRKHIVFLIGELTFFSRLIEGDYIDYDRIIVNSHRNYVYVDKKEMLSALERAALVTEEKIAGSVRSHVKLDINEDVLKISAVSTAGSTYEELFIEHFGEEILIAFNNRYLMDSIRACEGDNVKLSLSSPLTSMNIEPRENDYEENGKDEIFMLLPVRMKD
ncbi:MAG: DNA polymerase III subunit beta [Ruminococcaceae bacterium]|nr:DNA polymerase III subunit beta [Oscillospiraceae bacterium]